MSSDKSIPGITTQLRSNLRFVGNAGNCRIYVKAHRLNFWQKHPPESIPWELLPYLFPPVTRSSDEPLAWDWVVGYLEEAKQGARENRAIKRRKLDGPSVRIREWRALRQAAEEFSRDADTGDLWL